MGLFGKSKEEHALAGENPTDSPEHQIIHQNRTRVLFTRTNRLRNNSHNYGRK